MEIALDRYDELAARGAIKQNNWGDGRERACLMSALVTGARSEQDCAARGWPLWLAEAAVWLFDNYARHEAVARGRALAQAIHDADARGVDWDAVFCRVRMDAILPIALEAVGDGDEPWRAECRAVVQHAISVGGRMPTDDEKARAAWAAEAAWAARAARAAGAARAAWAAWAAWAATRDRIAAWAATRDRIEAALLKAMRD